MPGVIKMSYEDMENMAKVFEDSSQKINQTIGAMNNVVNLLHEGALQGPPGTALENAISQTLNQKLKQLADKMTELQQDIREAESDLRSADESGAKGL